MVPHNSYAKASNWMPVEKKLLKLQMYDNKKELLVLSNISVLFNTDAANRKPTHLRNLYEIFWWWDYILEDEEVLEGLAL